MNIPKYIIYRKNKFPWRTNSLYQIDIINDGKELNVKMYKQLEEDENYSEDAEIFFYEGNRYLNLQDKTFYLEDLKKKQFTSCTLFCLACKMEDNTILEFYNRTAFSMASRLRDYTYFGFTESNLIFLYVPYEDATFNDCSMVCTLGVGGVILSDSISWEEQVIDGSSGYDYEKLYDYVPHIEFSENVLNEINPDETIELDFKIIDNSGEILTNHDVDVYCSSTGGYLPITKLRVQNGTGKIRFTSLGLQSGETIKLKLGFKWYINDTVIEIKVR